MSLYITGDVHAQIKERFGYKNHPSLRGLNENDIIVVLGDWGVPWNHTTRNSDVDAAKFIDSKPWTTIALRGNHDNTNMMREMPQEELFGGKVRRLSIVDSKGRTYTCDHVFIVDEPTILTLCGERCLCIPGAQSHDIYPDKDNPTGMTILDKELDPQWKHRQGLYKRKFIPYRIKDVSWWEDEDIDIEKCSTLLLDNTQPFNLIFSHDCPGIVNDSFKRPGDPARMRSTKGQEYLESLRRSLQFDSWLHGHLHADVQQLSPVDDRLLCLYHSIVKASD